MNQNVELAKAIGSFIEKYWHIQAKVELPPCEFKREAIFNVAIDENSLNEVSRGLWIFKGSACILISDKSNVKMEKGITIMGSADVEFYADKANPSEKLALVKHVTITKMQ